MDKFKDKLKVNSPNSSKEDIKISFQVKIIKVTGLAKSSYSPLFISWKRGSKKENTGEIKSIPRDGEASIDHVINLNATITKTPKGYLEKTILFTVKEEKLGKKPTILGTIHVNLAQYADSKTEKTHPFPIQDKSKTVCNLYLGIQSSWLKVNGKSMVKAEGNQKEILQELGKQKVTHDGSDYFLQTEQELSEPDQTDFGHDSYDDDEEEHVDFDEESNDKSNVSTMSRKSSSGSIDKGEASSSSLATTPSKLINGHNRSGSTNSDKSLPPTTTTTTTTSTTSGTSNSSVQPMPTLIREESEEKDLNAMTADLKIKKYKKQLKTLKSELEKSKSNYSSLSKDRDEKVQEIKRMLDDMESIKDRSKTVGNGVITEYTNQIELLNQKLTSSSKDIENLKIQLQRERNQSSQDSNQVTVLQNQLLTINSQLDTIRNENTTLSNQIRTLEAQLRESSSNKPEELQNALATVQNLHLELNQLRSQLNQTTEENRNQFIQLEQERLKSNSNESNVNRVEQEKINLQQRLEHYERTIHLQLEDFEKEKLKISAELGELKNKLINYDQIEKELKELKEQQQQATPVVDDTELLAAKDQVVQLKDQVEKLQKQLQEQQAIPVVDDTELLAAKDEIIQLKKQLQEQQAIPPPTPVVDDTELLAAKDEITQLKKQLQEQQDQLQQVAATPIDETELLEAKDEIVQLKDKLSAKETLFKETEDQLEEVKNKLLEKENEISGFHIQLEQLKETIKIQSEEASSIVPTPLDDTELLSAKDEIIQLKDKLSAKESLFNEAEDQLIELRDRLSAKESLFKDTEDQLDSKENEIKLLREKLTEQQQQAQKEIEQLQSKLKEVELNSLDLTQSFEDKIKLLQQTSTANATSNEDELNELKIKFEKLKNKKNTYKVLVSNYKTTIDQLQEKQSSLESDEIEELKSKLSHNTQENQIVQDENLQLKQQIQSYQDDSSSKQNIINEYQEIISKLETEKEELEQQLENVKDSSNNDKDSDDESDNEIEEFKEKIQYQKEKIKALKEDLEAKSDEWIEIKIKMEELISNKQDEIDRLLEQQQQQQQASVVAVPTPTPSSNDNSKLYEEIDQLKLQIRQLEQDNQTIQSEKQFKIQHLEQELEQLKSQQQLVNSISASPRSNYSGSTGTGTGGDVEEIRKEMEENKNIESSIYWSELDFDRNNVPYCGKSVWAIIDGIGGLSGSQNTRLLNKIVVSLEKSFLRSGNDCKFISYWFSTVCYLLSKCHQAGYITQESVNPMKSGIEISVASFITPAPEIGGSFIRDLQALNLSIYSKLLSVTEIKLEKVLIQSIYLPDSIILEAQKSPIKSSGGGGSNPTSPLGRTGGNGNGNSINNLLNILDGIIQFLKEGRIFESVSNQFLNQIFYFMNSQITNHLLSNSSVCTTTQGLEVKMGVSRLKEWCSNTNYKSASQQLDSSLEASNLLVIDKNVFVDIEAIKSIFQKLNLHQIKKLLISFTPDSLSPDTLPIVLKKAIESNWRQSIDIDSLPLLIDQSKKFKL